MFMNDLKLASKNICVSPHLNFKYVIKHKLIKYLTRIRKQKLNEETVAIQIFALPGVSPKGFGGLAVTLELLGCVVLCLLGCAVVITAYVLWGLRVVVLVTGTVVVEGAKEVTVAFGVTFASSSPSSAPVGPQSINPATVVVLPSRES